MTFTSFVAAAQSSRDNRLPFITSIRAGPPLHFSKPSVFATLFDVLVKHRKLRNPRFNKLFTTLAPIKPLAPVIRIRSSVPIMNGSVPAETPSPPELGRLVLPLPDNSLFTIGMVICNWTSGPNSHQSLSRKQARRVKRTPGSCQDSNAWSPVADVPHSAAEHSDAQRGRFLQKRKSSAGDPGVRGAEVQRRNP